MKNALLIMIAALYLVDDTTSTYLSNKQVTLTLHTYALTWNEAQSVCESVGGNLMTEDSEERHAVFVAYKIDPLWQSYLNAHIWMGLHSPASITAEVDGEWPYGWTDCYRLNTTLYHYWKAAEPKWPSTQRCAVADKTSGNWITAACSETYMFLCETEAADCTYRHETGEPDASVSASYSAVIMTIPDDATCQSTCLTEQYSNLNCWAVHFDGSLTSDNCVLYYTTDPFLFDSTGSISASSKDFYIKQCYSIAVDTTEPGSLTNSNSAYPVEGCASLSDYVVATTTPIPTTTTTTQITTATGTTGVATTTPPPTTTTAADTAPTLTTTAGPITTTTPPTTTTVTSPTITTAAGPTATTTTTPPTTTTATSPTITTTAEPTTTTPSPPQPTTTTAAAPTMTTTAGPTTTTIAAITTAAATTTTTTTTGQCMCGCSALSQFIKNSTSADYASWANLTVEEKVEKLVEKLTVDKTTLSATVRRKTSAEDSRTQSTSIGVAGLLFITALLGGIVLSDAVKFVRFITHTGPNNTDSFDVDPASQY